MDREDVSIRPYTPADLDDLYEICLQTADSGKDATAIFPDPSLPGHLYAAPYALYEPSVAFVAEDTGGIGGYIIGALDSRAFERRLEAEWWPRLRGSYPDPLPDLAPGKWTLPESFAHLIHHPWSTPDELAERYPSHLHINLVPRLQGIGTGRRLIETFIERLRGLGSRGVHLHVGYRNSRAAAFYRHVGFRALPATDVHVFCMDLRT